MSFELNAIFSLTIGIAPIIGWLRFYKTDPAFLPFLLLLSAGFVNETLSIVLMKQGYTNIVNFNMFKLIETVLLLWQFYRWELFRRKKTLYLGLQLFFICTWLAENYLLGSFHSFNSFFIISHSFMLVMMSISMINKIIITDSTPVYQQPVFLICMGLIAYFTYAILIEAFWMSGLNQKRIFRLKIFEIMSYINLFTNLVFAFAFLWIPMRQRYILES